MREIVFDTETTGLDPDQGDRLVEIGCVELVNRIPTGQTFHRYLNPERDMPAEASRCTAFDRVPQGQAAVRRRRATSLLAFLGDAPLVAHNAMFDLGFLNAELERCRARPLIARERLVDTLMLARRKHPAARTGSTICARATPSTTRAAPSTARCSTPSCWPRSMSS